MALSTNRTLITQTGINTHQVLNVGGLDSAGIATFLNFKTGTTNVHNVGVELAGINVLGADTPIGTGSTIYDDGGARFSGVVTATTFSGSFTGDGQNLTGLPAGLGTALSNTQTLALNKVYYTDKVLSISTTTTVDPPTSASVAYTQYTDIKIEDGHDLIIKDGDELRPDVLGLSTTKTLDTNNFPDGLRGNLIGNVTGDVTGNVTATNVSAASSVTAATFHGSGANLTGLSAGLKMADQWRVSTSQSTSAHTVADITGWSRNNNNFAGVGDALTNSGANFTFPSTGIYYVSYNIATYITTGSARYISARLYFAGQDICHSWASAHHGASSGQTLQSTGSQAIIDVTNTATQTFKIRLQSSVPVTIVGLNEAGYNSSVNMSEVVVMRIGDT